MTVFISGVSTSGKTTVARAMNVIEPEDLAGWLEDGAAIKMRRPWRHDYQGWEVDNERWHYLQRVAGELVMESSNVVVIHPWALMRWWNPPGTHFLVILHAHPGHANERDPALLSYIQESDQVAKRLRDWAERRGWSVFSTREMSAQAVLGLVRSLVSEDLASKKH